MKKVVLERIEELRARNPFNKRDKRSKEQAFSIPELMIAVVVIGVLAAIATPMFLNARAEMESQTIRSELQQAAMFIETEAIDNNGLYSRYLPNEVLKLVETKNDGVHHITNPIYSYSLDRTEWCLQSDSPMGKLFISSTSLEVTSTPCTKAYFAEDCNMTQCYPWEEPTVTATTITSTSSTWAFNEATGRISVAWNPQTCVLAEDDEAEWRAWTRTEYSVIFVNSITGRPDSTLGGTPWQTETSLNNYPMNAGWLPRDNVDIVVQVRCFITWGATHAFDGTPDDGRNDNFPTSPSQTQTLAVFTVPNTTWNQQPSATWTWKSGSYDPTPDYTVRWNTVTCPIGETRWRMDVTGTLMNGSTNQALRTAENNHGAAWATTWSGDLNANTRGDTLIRTNHQVICYVADPLNSSNSRDYLSSGLVHSFTAPLSPPTALPTVEGVTSSTNPSTGPVVAPDRLRVTSQATYCPVGQLQIRANQTSPQIRSVIAYPAGSGTNGPVAHVDMDFAHNVPVTFTSNTRCVTAGQQSTETPAVTRTWTPVYTVPAVPTVPTLNSDDNGTIPHWGNDRLYWSAAVCDTSNPRYELRQTERSGTASITTANPYSLGAQTTVTRNFSVTEAPAGAYITSQIRARCIRPDNTTMSAWSSWGGDHRFATSVPAPSAPTNFRYTAGTLDVAWSAPTSATNCPTYSSTLQTQYHLRQTLRYHNQAGNWTILNWSTALSNSMNADGHRGVNQRTEVAARCVSTVTGGASASSSYVGATWAPDLIYYPAPFLRSGYGNGVAPAAGHGISPTCQGGPSGTAVSYSFWYRWWGTYNNGSSYSDSSAQVNTTWRQMNLSMLKRDGAGNQAGVDGQNDYGDLAGSWIWTRTGSFGTITCQVAVSGYTRTTVDYPTRSYRYNV